MGFIRDKIQQFILQTVATKSIVDELSVMATGANIEQPDSDVASNMKAYKAEVVVYRCLNAIGQNLISSPLVAERQVTIEGELEWEIQTQGELVELIKSPNDQDSMDLLLWLVAVSLGSTGNAFIAHPKDDPGLWFLPPDWVSILRTKEGQTGYEVKNLGQIRKFELDEITHIKLPNPFDPYYGLAPIESIRVSILTSFYNRRFYKNFFKNGGVPSGVLSSDQDLTEDQIKRTIAEWQRAHGGFEQSNKIAVLGAGAKYETVTPPLKDLVVDQLSKMTREDIAMALGVPPLVLGIVDDANRANSREQMRGFWEGVILPWQRFIQAAINKQFVEPRYGADQRIRFDNSDQDVLQEDQNIRAERVTKVYQAGVMTLNEARQRLDLEAVEDGDTFRQPVPSPFAPPADSQNSAQREISERKPQGKKTPEDRLRDAHVRNLDKLEPDIERILVKYWDGQLDRILTNMRKTTVNGKLMSRIGAALTKIGEDVEPSDIDGFFKLDDEAGILGDAMKPKIAKIVQQAGDDALSDWSIALDFNVDNPEVQNVIQKFTNRSIRINDKTYKDVRRILKEVYDEGLGIDEAERMLRDLFKSYYKVQPGDPGALTRGKRFARTELNGYVNGGAFEAHKQAGVEKKQWLAVFDGATRDWHASADGEIVRINEPFINSGEPMMYPGDPNGTPANVINCRCTYIPIFD